MAEEAAAALVQGHDAPRTPSPQESCSVTNPWLIPSHLLSVSLLLYFPHVQIPIKAIKLPFKAGSQGRGCRLWDEHLQSWTGFCSLKKQEPAPSEVKSVCAPSPKSALKIRVSLHPGAAAEALWILILALPCDPPWPQARSQQEKSQFLPPGLC